MFEDFKEKIKEQNHPEKARSNELTSEIEAKLKEKGIDPETVTLDDVYPERLDQEGNDLSLMSGFELDIWVTYCRTRHYLAEKYPLSKEANQPGQAEDFDEAPQINIEKARDDPKSKSYLEALDKMIPIIAKLLVLQTHANRFEKICLRYNPGGELHIGNTTMGHPWDAKYGLTRPQIFRAIRLLQAEGVKQFGLHTLLASNSTDQAYYPTIAKMLFKLAKEAHEMIGAEFFMINLSGGIGIPYRPQETSADIFEISREVQKLFAEMIAPSGMNVNIASELGRYMTGPHGCLVATAIHEKHIYKEYIGLDACAANLMRPAIYGAYHHITVAGKENLPNDHIYDVVGSLCENNDKFAVDRPLPKIEIGDLVVIHDTGAHGYSMGYNYNGKLRSAEILLHPDGTFDRIRRAEAPKDYFATLDETEFYEKLVNQTEVDK